MFITTDNVKSTPSQEDPTKYCCSVVPVRYVLLVLAMLALFLSTFYGTVGILVLQRLSEFVDRHQLLHPNKELLDVHLTDLHRMAIYFHVFVHLSFGFICVLGFVTTPPYSIPSLLTYTVFRICAALSKRPGVTSLCIAIVLGQLLFNIGSGALCLYLLFKTSPSQDLSADKCVAISSDLFTQNLCQRTRLMKGIAVTSLTIIWLAEIGRSICEVLAFATNTHSSDGGCRQLLPISA